MEEMTQEVRAEQEKLIEELWNRSPEAWDLIEKYTVRSFLKESEHYRNIANDFQLDSLTIRNMLMVVMLQDQKLKLYAYRGRVSYWMKSYVRKILSEYCKKNELGVSDEESQEVFIEKDDNREIWEVVEASFSKLWKENPMEAYVYQLRMYHNLPAKEVASSLGITSSNVDTIFKRAKEDMALFLQEMGGAA